MKLIVFIAKTSKSWKFIVKCTSELVSWRELRRLGWIHDRVQCNAIWRTKLSELLEFPSWHKFRGRLHFTMKFQLWHSVVNSMTVIYLVVRLPTCRGHSTVATMLHAFHSIHSIKWSCHDVTNVQRVSRRLPQYYHLQWTLDTWSERFKTLV